MNLEKYPKLDDYIIKTGNSNSMFNRGNNLKASYEEYLTKIDTCKELTETQKIEVAEKLHNLYTDYAYKSVNVVSPMVAGWSNYPARRANKQMQGVRGSWDKIEKFLKKYEFVFNPDNMFGMCVREANNNSDALFQNDYYKIIEYSLNTGEKRIGFHFKFRIQRQLQVALKSRGFRWNHLKNLWGGKVESYEKHKEWCHTLVENYEKYIK